LHLMVPRCTATNTDDKIATAAVESMHTIKTIHIMIATMVFRNFAKA